MWKRLTELLMPFAVIAKQLTRLADLKELELRERVTYLGAVSTPIIPVTEEPSRGDTTVFYDDENKPKSKLRKLMDGITDDEDDDDIDPLDEDTLS